MTKLDKINLLASSRKCLQTRIFSSEALLSNNHVTDSILTMNQTEGIKIIFMANLVPFDKREPFSIWVNLRVENRDNMSPEFDLFNYAHTLSVPS